MDHSIQAGHGRNNPLWSTPLSRWLSVISLVIAGLAGCERPAAPAPATGASTAAPTKPQPAQVNSVELVFPYGSEKKAWIDAATQEFVASGVKTASGRSIVIKPLPMGSGDVVDETLSGRLQAHIVSPASAAFVKLGNAKSQATTGGPLVGQTQDLVLSPVVIAMWKPMAEALGWPKKEIGWSDVLAVANDPSGWASVGKPQWGAFRFGHTHPEYSNSGLMAVIAQIYAFTGKTANLTLSDLQTPKVAQQLEQIQRSLVHYGDSTGFFAKKMFAGGPAYLSAAVLYENTIIETMTAPPGSAGAPAMPVVAIYPKEGTFWSDHPIGIVQRAWVTAEHQDAANQYIKFLLSRPQQTKAMSLGFRPSDVGIALASPIEASSGVDPKQPVTTLQAPEADVINASIELWRVHKKKSDIVLVMDTSGSMGKDRRMDNARPGAVALLEMLGNEDRFSLLSFSTKSNWAMRSVKVSDHRSQAIESVNNLFPGGGTALYDSISEAYTYLVSQKAVNSDRISAIVVLTDGEDTESKLRLAGLLSQIQSDRERQPIRVFTIGYGNEADGKILQNIADKSGAKFFKGTPQNIRQVFKEIATFF